MSLSPADRLDIIDVVTRADAAATARDVDGYVACFTDTARIVGAMGEHDGTDALRRDVGPIWASEGAATAHLCLNAVIDEEGDGRAQVRSILLIVASSQPFTPLGMSAITQNLVRTGDGWKIAVRAVHDLGSGGP